MHFLRNEVSLALLLVLVAFIEYSAAVNKFFCITGPDGNCEEEGSMAVPAATADIPKGANPDGRPREAIRDCVDRHDQCVGFARQGECTKNPGWMIINCPKSCDAQNNACVLRDPNLRCDRAALNMSTSPIYNPGTMNHMFSTIKER
jgi:hypothetical protein